MNEEAKKGVYKVLTIKKIISEAPDFKTFVFEEGHNIKYAAGQFLTLVHNPGSNEIRRSYSITSSPVLNEPLAIGVKRIPNGFFSRLLVDTAVEGQTIYCSGSGGFFRLPENISNFDKIIFFAAGSGITPVLSLIKTALHAFPHIHILLLYSNTSRTSAAYYDQLISLETKFKPRLHIHFLFSSSADLLRARLNRDLFFEFLYADNVDVDTTLFYTCGPVAYMRMVIYLLEEFGVDEKQIRKEDFIPFSANPKRNIPPDTGSYFVTVHSNDETFRFKVNYPDTILRAAKKQNIILPYSCENGRCGNCAARCIKGKVWMSNNEVLTDADQAKGLTLTCVGHPVNGDVELDLSQ